MVFGLFKKDRDTSEIDVLLLEIQRIGRRMGGLAMMTEAERARVIRVFKLDLIINSVREYKELFVEAHRQVSVGKINGSKISHEVGEFRETLVEYNRYLDVLNKQGNDDTEFFVERDGVASYF